MAGSESLYELRITVLKTTEESLYPLGQRDLLVSNEAWR